MTSRRSSSGWRGAAALVVAIVGLAAGCGESTRSDRATADAQAPARGGAIPAAPAVPLVPHEQLAAAMPVIEGWQRDQLMSARVNLPAAATHASASYARGKARVDLEITDTAGAAAFIEPLTKVAGTSFLQQASNGYMKGTTIGDYPAVESWNHTDGIGDVSLLVDKRFILHATGTGLENVDALRKIIETIDARKLAALPR